MMSSYSEHRHAKQPQSKQSPSSTRRRKNKGRRPQLEYQGSWDRKDFSTLVINTDDDSMQFATGIRLLTYDFVVRSLRRRLWKAFREEDVATATRAYQATLPDFVRWLEEEKQEKRNREREYDADRGKSNPRNRSISPASSRSRSPSLRHPRRSSFDQASWDHARNRRPRRGKRPGRRVASKERDKKPYEENNIYRSELLNHEYQQQMETESMIGGPGVAILQSRMNPSDPFIADDYLSPYDYLTYDNPAQKTLPDPVQHAAEQRALEAERKRQRKARSPRMAFRRMITGRRTNSSSIDDHDDFELVNSMIVDASNNPFYPSEFDSGALGNSMEEEDPLMTTPLHEAARIGAGDFVRLLLADGGDANAKNGDFRTAIHLCAGGITVEEQKIVEAIAAAEEGRSGAYIEETILPDKKKKKKYQKMNKQKSPPASAIEPMLTTTPTIGIQPTVIPKECLELMRQIDSDTFETTKDQKKSHSKSSSKRRLFGKIFSPKKDKSNHNNNPTGDDLDFSFTTYGSSELLSNHMHTHTPFIAEPERLDEIITDRMEAMLALLSFVHKESSEGPSINAVDNNGRTSLHYAAELGRSDICTAMLSHFGIILTIVDESGTRTPCEVASHQGHTALAALLEARALLYIDPYGLDDEMMDMITAANEGGNGNGSSSYKRNNPNGRIVPPYRWFINLSKEEIAHERLKQLEEARENLILAFLEPPTPNETDEFKASVSGAIRNNRLFGPRRANLEPYIVDASDNDRRQLKSPPSSNKEVIENYDDKKPPPSDNQGTSNNGDGEEKLLKLQNRHIELYMTHHNWDLSAALDAFRQNRDQAFAAAGIHNFFDEEKKETNFELDANACLCPICYDDDVEKEDWIVLQNCGHGFCRDCLVDYAQECANNRTPAHMITCPDHNCNSEISKLDLQAVLGEDHPEIFGRISKASTDNFITSHTNFRFCPHPGCSGIVHRFRQPKWASADYDESILNYTGAVCTAVTPTSEKIGNECTLTYEGVEDPNYTNCRSRHQPKKAHRFCFSCGDAVHWPLTCERLEEWKKRIGVEIGKVDDGDGNSDFNELAQKIWLKANTRPCPKCNIPIEKNDGCNHMVCHSCHHEFCWICRQDWKLHSTDTGGFFRCNIWKEDDPDRIGEDGGDQSGARSNSNNFLTDSLNDSGYGTSIHTTRRAWKKKQDIKRFLHHYSRWEAHKDSHLLEQKMGDTVCTRFAPVVEAAIQFDGSPAFNFGGKGLSFIHNAFFELEECRSTLRHSYAFSFFRYASKSSPSPISYLGSKRKEKFRFERLQSELETLTEQMSDIVARSHLRASQIQITYLTAGAAEKRLELNNFLFQIFREEKREAVRQKNRESEKIAEDDKRKQSPRMFANLPTQDRGNESSSTVEMFNRLMRIRDHRYEVNTPPYLTMGDLPSNARDLSMQLMAQDQRLLALGEQLRGMEVMLRHQARIRTANDDNESPRFVYYANADNDDENDNHDQSDNEPATDMWDCALCTYMNTGGSFCAMCETPR